MVNYEKHLRGFELADFTYLRHSVNQIALGQVRLFFLISDKEN